MSAELTHGDASTGCTVVTWFAAERPTDAGTTFVKPIGDETAGDGDDQARGPY